jgi:WD40 repeat protein
VANARFCVPLILLLAGTACDDTVRYGATAPAVDSPSDPDPGPAVSPGEPDRQEVTPDGEPEPEELDPEPEPIAQLLDSGPLSDLRFSADGTVLAYLRDAPIGRPNHALHLYHVPTGHSVVATDRYAGNLDMSPDGRSVIFKHNMGETWSDRVNLHIFRWDPEAGDDTATVQRIDTAVDDGSASFSPDGGHVFYSHQQSSHPRLRGWDVKAASRLTLNPMVQSDFEFLVFSGTTMAYVVETWRHDGNRRYDTANLHLYNLRTGQDRDTGVNLYFDHQVRFSAAGDRLGYQESTRDEEFRTHGNRFHVRHLGTEEVRSTEAGIRQLVVADDLDRAAFQRPDQGRFWPGALVVQTMATGQVDLVTERTDAYPIFFTATHLLYLTGPADGPHALHAYDTKLRQSQLIDPSIGLLPGVLHPEDRSTRRALVPVRPVGSGGTEIAFFQNSCTDGLLQLWNTQTGTLTHTIEGHGCELAAVAGDEILLLQQRDPTFRRLWAWHLESGAAQQYARSAYGLNMRTAPDGAWTVAQVFDQPQVANARSHLEAINWAGDSSQILAIGTVDEYAVTTGHAASITALDSVGELWLYTLEQ